MARIAKFFQPGAAIGHERQVAAITERGARYDNATDATVAALRGNWDAEGARIAKLAEELGIEHFADPLKEIDSRLARAIESAKMRLEALSLERALAGVNVAGQGMTAPLTDQKKKDLATRLAALMAKLEDPDAEPVKRPAGALPEAVERALAVADAQPVAKKLAPEKLREQLLDQVDELELGRRELAEMVEVNRKEVSYQACLKAKAAHDELLADLYRTAQKFAVVAAHEQTFRMVFPTFGLTARSDILPMPGQLMQTILILGNDVDYGSALSEYRRFLESRGILK